MYSGLENDGGAEWKCLQKLCKICVKWIIRESLDFGFTVIIFYQPRCQNSTPGYSLCSSRGSLSDSVWVHYEWEMWALFWSEYASEYWQKSIENNHQTLSFKVWQLCQLMVPVLACSPTLVPVRPTVNGTEASLMLLISNVVYPLQWKVKSYVPLWQNMLVSLSRFCFLILFYDAFSTYMDIFTNRYFLRPFKQDRRWQLNLYQWCVKRHKITYGACLVSLF